MAAQQPARIMVERVEFRLIHMECCDHLLCWVNPRLPSYCPSCGKLCYPKVRGWALQHDGAATLTIHQGAITI
jgi:hypothetical protein